MIIIMKLIKHVLFAFLYDDDFFIFHLQVPTDSATPLSLCAGLMKSTGIINVNADISYYPQPKVKNIMSAFVFTKKCIVGKIVGGDMLTLPYYDRIQGTLFDNLMQLGYRENPDMIVNDKNMRARDRIACRYCKINVARFIAVPCSHLLCGKCKRAVGKIPEKCVCGSRISFFNNFYP